MSEENNTQQAESNGLSDVEKLQAKNGEIIGKNKELKEVNSSLASKIESLEGTLSKLGQLVGVQEGEDIATKAQELIKAKEQEAFDKMSETEKLSHRLKEIESDLQNQKLAKEKAEKEALGLRIDDKIKSSFSSNGVKDENALKLALTGFKALYGVEGVDGDSFVTSQGVKPINELMNTFLEGNRYLISNPSKSGSGFNGGKVVSNEQAEFKQAKQKAKETGRFTDVVGLQLAQLKQQ